MTQPFFIHFEALSIVTCSGNPYWVSPRMVSDSPDGVFTTICFLLQTIWAWLWDNHSIPSTTSKPANLKGSRDRGKEWFLMEITHPSNTVETVSMVPSASSTS
ncbi:hypothetical protein Hanom_Chr15g01404971 [Helianthus anomalus]